MIVLLGETCLTRFGPNRVAADMEGNGEFDFLEIFEDFWRISWRFLEIVWGILEKLVRCEKKIKNFHQLETNKENEVLRPLWPPNSLRGHIWHQIWNLWPKLHMLPCLFGQFRPVLALLLSFLRRFNCFVSEKIIPFDSEKIKNFHQAETRITETTCLF